MPLAAWAATFTATVDRDTVTLGESVTLSLTFSGGEPKSVPMPPAVPGLQVSYNGQSSQISIVNGQMSSTVTHSYVLTPRQVGELVVPSFSVQVGAQQFTTQPLRLTVVKPDAPSAQAANSGNELALLRFQLPKKQFYVGEMFAAELQLLLRQEVQSVKGFQLTAFPAEGFSVGKMVEGGRRQVRLGNAVYTVIPLLFPIKVMRPGAAVIGPVTATVVVELPRRRSRDPWDSFGMNLFGGEQRQLALASAESGVECLPLPVNAPAGFKGAVGQFALKAEVGPTNVAVGDPITLKVQVSGRGALDTLELPDQPAWANFKVYPPTSKIETSDQLGIQGVKHFEQVLVPEKTDIDSLPGVVFSFFDPETKAYRTLAEPAVPIVVRPGGATVLPTVVAAKNGEDNSPPVRDIVHIKPRLGMVARVSPPLLQRPWFVALQTVPLLAYVFALVWRRRVENLANNPRLRRQRHVATVVRNGLADLRRYAAENNSDEFFATVFRLLQEQIGERLDVPASAITEAVVAEQLRPRGVPEDLAASLDELFQICNLARYAPIRSSQELSALVPKIEHALQSLQAVTL